MAHKLIIHFEDDAMTFASMGNVFITMAVGPITMQHITHLERIIDDVRRRSPSGKTVGVSIARMNKVNVPEDVRAKLHESMQRWKDMTNAAATVLEGSGLAATAIRAVITAMTLVSRASYPTKTFSNVTEATTWALQYCDASWTAEDKEECAKQIYILSEKRRTVAA